MPLDAVLRPSENAGRRLDAAGLVQREGGFEDRRARRSSGLEVKVWLGMEWAVPLRRGGSFGKESREVP